MTTVAVVGLGAMGSRMARRLLAAGHEVVVWNRTAARAAELADHGARPAASPAEAAARAEAVITMVASPAALRAVSEGDAGIAAGARPETTVIEMSTVGPSSVRRLRTILPDATPLLDAPVLGSLAEAESGSLRIFVGGPVELAERWMGLLSILGSPRHVGPLGSGASAKLVANSALLGTLTLLGEALALADGLGLPRDVAWDVLAATPLAAQAERRRPAVEADAYPPRFSVTLAHKDGDVIAEEAEGAGVDVRLLRAARSWLAEADVAEWGEKDYAAVVSHITSRRPEA